MRLLLVHALLLLMGCAGRVIVDRDVYINNMRWFETMQQFPMERLNLARKDARRGDMLACQGKAVRALAYSILIPHRVAFALYAADLGPDPGPRPPVPLAEVWCREARSALEAGTSTTAVDVLPFVVTPPDDPSHPVRIHP